MIHDETLGRGETSFFDDHAARTRPHANIMAGRRTARYRNGDLPSGFGAFCLYRIISADLMDPDHDVATFASLSRY